MRNTMKDALREVTLARLSAMTQNQISETVTTSEVGASVPKLSIFKKIDET